MMMKKALVVAMAVASISAHAEIEGSLSAGILDFDPSRNLDSAATVQAGLSYDLTPSWALGLDYLTSNPDVTSSASDVDVDIWKLSGIYSFDAIDGWTPYGILGLADGSYGNDNATLLNGGIGLKKSLSNALSLFTDLQAYQSLDEGNTDIGARLGLAYAFGAQPEAAPAEPAPAAPAPVAPVVVAAPVILDTDGDGVLDNADQCAATPAGVSVDATGCPLDTDQDGVFDSFDECKSTPPSVVVDTVGCPVTAEKIYSVDLEVRFPSNSAEIGAAYYDELTEVVTFMRKYPNTEVEIAGHTDSQGSAAYNKALSERRAKAVAAVLAETYGIDASRITAVGYGESSPIATNDTAEGRLSNRRVVADISTRVKEVVTK